MISSNKTIQKDTDLVIYISKIVNITNFKSQVLICLIIKPSKKKHKLISTKNQKKAEEKNKIH
jgi:hypothetical protein